MSSVRIRITRTVLQTKKAMEQLIISVDGAKKKDIMHSVAHVSVTGKKMRNFLHPFSKDRTVSISRIARMMRRKLIMKRFPILESQSC